MAKKNARSKSGACGKTAGIRRTHRNSRGQRPNATAGDSKLVARPRRPRKAPEGKRPSRAQLRRLARVDLASLWDEHRNVYDLFWNYILNRVDQLPDEFEIDCYRLEAIPANSIPIHHGHGFGRADAVYYPAGDADDTWAEARKLIGRDPRFSILNVESKKAQSPQADGEQFYYYRHGLRVELGLNIHVIQRGFITGPTPPNHRLLQSGGPDNADPARKVPCIHVDDLHADRLPPGFYESAAGAVGALVMPHGATLAHVMHAFRRWVVTAEETGAVQRPWLFAMALQIEPKLATLYEQAMQLTQEGNMDPELSAAIKQNWEIMHDYVAGVTEAFNDQDLDAIPRVRERLDAERAEAEAQGRTEGRDLNQVDNLLELLQIKSIQLSPAQEKRLRKLANGKLPSIAVAYQATSAADFMRRAELGRTLNGRRPRRK